MIGFLSLWLVWPVLELQTNSHTVWTLFCLFFFFFIQHNGFYICVTVCTLAWKLSWTEKPGRLESMGLLRSDMTEGFHFHFHDMLYYLHKSNSVKIIILCSFILIYKSFEYVLGNYSTLIIQNWLELIMYGRRLVFWIPNNF